MNIYDSCRQALKEEYAKGITQEELGKRAGISHAHINRLLNGRSSFCQFENGNHAETSAEFVNYSRRHEHCK